MDQGHWHIELHEDFDYERFLRSLDGRLAAALGEGIKQSLASQGAALAGTHKVKPLGDRLFEYRLRVASTVTPGGGLIRVLFTYRKGRIILLLGAYDKLSDPSKKRQQAEISIARKRIWR